MSAFESVFDAFRAQAERTPDAPFLCLPARDGRDYFPLGAEFSYREILATALALRDRYLDAGVGQGHRVAILLENRPAFFHHWLALNAIGAGIVPINPDYREGEVAYLLEHSDAVLAVGIALRCADLERASATCTEPPSVVDADAMPAAFPVLARPPPARPGHPRPDTECAMLYTSGTTGRPKGCILSNAYFLNAGHWYTTLGGAAAMTQGHERVYNPLPLYHMNALAVSATGMILTGGCAVVPDCFHPGAWWDDVVSTRATVVHYLGVVPPLLLARRPSVREREHRVRFGLGAGVDPDHHAAFEKRFGFPLVEVWGMTETGRIYADVDEPRRVGTRAFGRPARGLEARVVDDAGHDVACGEPGELLVRFEGPDPRRGFFSGYYKADGETERAWLGGWFHSGDTVRQDDTGMLYFVDRKKNIIRRSGENIAAAEVEATLQAHPEVVQAAVVGVPDDLREEEVYACVVLTHDASADADTLFEWCAERLAYFKLPGYVQFRDALPTTGTNKVQKTSLFDAGVDPRALPGCIDFTGRKRRASRDNS